MNKWSGVSFHAAFFISKHICLYKLSWEFVCARQLDMKEIVCGSKKTVYNGCIFRHDGLFCSLFQIGLQTDCNVVSN